MAKDDLAQPHDNLFRAVFGEPAEAVGLLRAHLPPAVADGLQWSTLSAENSAFIAPDLRATESDLLYSIRRRAGGAPAWLYVLLEHQSTVRRRDRWMRLRLLQYCCRIWDRDRRRYPGVGGRACSCGTCWRPKGSRCAGDLPRNCSGRYRDRRETS